MGKRDRVEEFNHRWALRVVAWAKNQGYYGPAEALRALEEALEETHQAAFNSKRALGDVRSFEVVFGDHEEASAVVVPPGTAPARAVKVTRDVIKRAIELAVKTPAGRQTHIPK